MGLHFFSVSFRPNNSDRNKVFIGAAYDTFSKWMRSIVSIMPHLEYDGTVFGTHSFRKGIATYCSGFKSGPPFFAILLRGGWSLGEVMDRYIRFTEGANQLCGRVACVINFNDGAKFSVLPPRFINNSNIMSNDEYETISWLATLP
jgi:hypothetical protein